MSASRFSSAKLQWIGGTSVLHLYCSDLEIAVITSAYIYTVVQQTRCLIDFDRLVVGEEEEPMSFGQSVVRVSWAGAQDTHACQ